MPTFDDYLPQVLAATGPGALHAYRSGALVTGRIGGGHEQRLDEVVNVRTEPPQRTSGGDAAVGVVERVSQGGCQVIRR
ncbi:hypothetical protein AB0K00_10275 [Dactylosporangium sp. NPDC049525]|uniref:hypothetical protein n=1 Tax=Dactylosporangium sp. NPDC049525 TaxID=3154730 RepID=UPI00343BFEE1